MEPFGFVRRYGEQRVVVLAALRAGALLFGTERLAPAPEVWGDARLDYDLSGLKPVWGPQSGGARGWRPCSPKRPVAVWAEIRSTLAIPRG